MRRFRFDLEKLLELRAYREKEAEQALGRAIGELVSIETRVKEVAEERTSVAANRFGLGRSAADMLAAERYILRLDQTRDSLIEDAAKAELAVEAARDAFIEAARERKVIDKLKEKRKAEYRRTASLEEIKVVDDISSGTAARTELKADG